MAVTFPNRTASLGNAEMIADNPQVDGDSAPNKRKIAARLGKLFSARARSPSPLPGSPTTPLSPRYKEPPSSIFVSNTPPRSPTKTPPPVVIPNGARKKVVQFRRRLSETSPEEVEERKVGMVRSQTAVFTFDRPANRRLVDRRLSANAVEDLLECPVCNERFNRPKMLPCQHTFCAKCLRDQITYSRGRVNNFLQCPLCQLQVKLKIRFVEELEGALDSLPSNLYIDSLLAVLQNESPQQQQQQQHVQEPEVRCSKCQTVCSARICNHCKQNFCGVCWPSHMTELRVQLGELLEQLKGAKDRLEHRAEDFKALCEKLREHIDSAVGQRLEELRAEQARLQEEAGQVVEAAERSASQLMERLGEAEENVTTGGGFDNMVDDNQKVATFLSLHRSTAELLDEVSHWGEARPTFDQENFRIDLQDDLANGTNADDVDEIDENAVDEERKFKPELIKNADDMCLYYRSRPFSARALLGHALLHRPAGVGVAPWGGGSQVYVAGTDNNQVLAFDLTKGRLLQRLTAPNMKCPQGLTFCPRRMEIYVTDKWSHCIHVFDKEGHFLRKLCVKGHGEGQLRSPEGISLGPDPANQEGALLYVCDTGNDRVQILDPDTGSFINQIGIIGGEKGRINKNLLTEFNQPTGVAVSKDRIVVIDFGNRRVKLFTLAGEKVKEFGAMGSSGGQFLSPECVAVDPLGFILVGDSGNARVQIFQPDGALVRVFGKRGTGPGKIRWVSGLHVTPDMDIIVTDFKNHCVQIF